MRWVFVLLALGAFSAPAEAEHLKYLTSDASGTDLYVDSDSVRRMVPVPGKRPFPAVQVWTIYDYSKVKREPARSARALVSFNCQQRTMTILAYVKKRPDGRPLHDWRQIDYDFKYEAVKGETMNAFAMADACGFPPPPPLVPPPPPVFSPAPGMIQPIPQSGPVSILPLPKPN